jgi:hypothetical protein
MTLVRRIPDTFQQKSNRLVQIYDEQPFSQKINIVNNGFSTLLIHLKNAQLLNVDPFTFSLFDEKGALLRKIDISGRNIGDGEMVRFQFPFIADSQGKTYIVTLAAPDTKQTGHTVEAGVSAQGELAFEAYYRPLNVGKVMIEVGGEVTRKMFYLPFVVAALLLFWVARKLALLTIR